MSRLSYVSCAGLGVRSDKIAAPLLDKETAALLHRCCKQLRYTSLAMLQSVVHAY
jgi:hypothetical protein